MVPLMSRIFTDCIFLQESGRKKQKGVEESEMIAWLIKLQIEVNVSPWRSSECVIIPLGPAIARP